MIALDQGAPPTRRSGWRFISRVMQAGAILALLSMAGGVFSALDWAWLARAMEGGAFWLVGLGAAIYMLGHLLRAFRLALLIGGWRVGLRDIVSFHLMTAAASLAVPFKLGEIYRVAEMANIAGGGVRGVIVAWWERLLDAVLILILLALMFWQAASEPAAALAFVTLAFVALSAAVFWVLPENIRRLQVLIIRRYSAPRTVRLLQALEQSRRAIETAPWVVRGKAASLGTLTALVWVCEIIAFSFVAAAADGSGGANALLDFLSSLVQGATLLGAAGSAPSSLLLYLLATHGVLALIGLAAAFYYVRRKPAATFFPRTGERSRP